MNTNLLGKILIAAALVSLVAFVLVQAPAVLAHPADRLSGIREGLPGFIDWVLRSVPLYREGVPGISRFGIESAGV
jgi:hypothetical protein